MVVQHAGTGAAVSGASSGCQLSNEELTVTCLAPLPLKLQLPLLGLSKNIKGWASPSFYTFINKPRLITMAFWP